MGYNVKTFTSSIKALDNFRFNPKAFDIVITDLAMPVMNGKELAKQTNKIRSDIPIILSSGCKESVSLGDIEQYNVKKFLN